MSEQPKGIDVSKWQAVTPDLAGLDFLIARASVGLSSDGLYQEHIANARAAGLVVGAYHFAYTGNIAAQAATFLRAAGNVDYYFIDVEGKSAPTHDETAAFIDAMHTADKTCGLYHSDSGYFDAGQDYDWVANWTRQPTRHWDFWQYRGSPLDLDYFNGTVAELRRESQMRNFEYVYDADGKVIAGSLTVHGADHYWLRLVDGKLLGPARDGWAKQAVKVRLTEDITSTPHPGVDRRTGYLIGDKAAFFLESDVTFTRYPDRYDEGRVDGEAEGYAEGYDDAKVKAAAAVGAI